MRTRIGNDAKGGAAHIANINKTRGDAGAGFGKKAWLRATPAAGRATRTRETVAMGFAANLELRLPGIPDQSECEAERGDARFFLHSEENAT